MKDNTIMANIWILVIYVYPKTIYVCPKKNLLFMLIIDSKNYYLLSQNSVAGIGLINSDLKKVIKIKFRNSNILLSVQEHFVCPKSNNIYFFCIFLP